MSNEHDLKCLCRICGKRLRTGKKKTVVCECHDHKGLKKAFDVDIDLDIPEIQRKSFCYLYLVVKRQTVSEAVHVS